MLTAGTALRRGRNDCFLLHVFFCFFFLFSSPLLLELPEQEPTGGKTPARSWLGFFIPVLYLLLLLWIIPRPPQRMWYSCLYPTLHTLLMPPFAHGMGCFPWPWARLCTVRTLSRFMYAELQVSNFGTRKTRKTAFSLLETTVLFRVPSSFLCHLHVIYHNSKHMNSAFMMVSLRSLVAESPAHRRSLPAQMVQGPEQDRGTASYSARNAPPPLIGRQNSVPAVLVFPSKMKITATGLDTSISRPRHEMASAQPENI